MTPLTWNTDRSGNRSRVYGGWHNWLDQSGWRALDGGFREDSGRYVASQIPGLYSVPALATGSVEFEVNQRYDIFSKSMINDAPWSLEITPENVRPIAAQRDDNMPDQIVYPNAFADGVDLRYTVWIGRAPRVTREIVIRKEPPGDHDLRGSWLLRSNNVTAYVRGPTGQLVRPWSGIVADRAITQGQGVILRAGRGLNESEMRGSGIRTPTAWYYLPDGTLVSTPITVEFEIVAVDTVRATKVIPRAFIREAFAAGAMAVMSDDTSTFYPDPHAESTSVDGYVQESTTQSWSSLRSDVGSSNIDNSSPLIVAVYSGNTTNTFYNMHRSICGFDLSSLSGQTALSSTFGSTYYTSVASHDETAAVALCGATPASNTDLVNADYSQLGSSRYCDTDVDETAWAGVMTWELNATGISAANSAIGGSGILNLGLRLAFDIDDSAPTWTSSNKNSNLQVKSAENAGTSDDPYLEVTTGTSFATRHSGSGGGIGGGIGYGICDKIRG